MNTELLMITAVVLLPIFFIAWRYQQRSKNAGWVDVIWAFGVGSTGVFYAIVSDGEMLMRVTVASVYGLWFGRLGWHLMQRVKGEPEDSRYAVMRTWANHRASMVFLFFYLMQASWVWIFALPAWLLSDGNNPPLWALVVAIVIFLVAWAGEALADHQLELFRREATNKGSTCRQGLWRYSRHPNYFFEWCHWFIYPVLGIGLAFGWWLWLAPVVMFVFLYFVTGIPFSEQQAIRSRGDDYRHYQRTTSMFFPWKPKSGSRRP